MSITSCSAVVSRRVFFLSRFVALFHFLFLVCIHVDEVTFAASAVTLLMFTREEPKEM